LICHISNHRTSYNDIVKVADNVEYAVMNEHTPVTYLLDSIQCNHQQLVAAKTAILSDDAKLVKSGSIQPDFTVSAVKQGDNKSQVELHYYKKKEYAKLTKEQKDELQ
jgi:hypothetical protein